MKKMTIPPLVVLAAVLGTGCSNHDSEKIDALTQKVALIAQNQSVVISNQFAIFNELEAVKSQVTNLPTLSQIDSMAFYYHTNALNSTQDRMMAVAIMLNRIDDCVARAEFGITNRMMADTIYTRLTVDDIDKELHTGDMARSVFMINATTDSLKNDLRAIKNRLGIIY